MLYSSNMATINGYTIVGALAIGGVVYYMYKQSKQNKKQHSFKPKNRYNLPKQVLGNQLNNMFTRSWVKVDKQYNPNGALEKRVV